MFSKLSAGWDVANLRAPEHLEIMTKDARALSEKIRHVGAIFIRSKPVQAIRCLQGLGVIS